MRKLLFNYLYKIDYKLPSNWRNMSVGDIMRDMCCHDTNNQLVGILNQYIARRILETILKLSKADRVKECTE